MNRLRLIAVTNLCVFFIVFAGTASGEQSKAGPFAPLVDIYDTTWVRSEDGSVKSLEQVADELSQFDVVFFGEFHGHSGIHLAQQRLFAALHNRHANMTLSLEQFERDTQHLVNLYLEGKIGEKVLEEKGRAWPNYAQSYRPLVEFAKDNSLPVVASNAPKEMVICISKEGTEILDSIPMPDRNWVARELHIEEGPYLDKYRSFMESSSTHGPDGPDESGADENCVDLGPETVRQQVQADTDEKSAMKAEGGEKKGHMASGGMGKKGQMADMGSDDEVLDEEAKKAAEEQREKIMNAMVMKSFSAQVTRDDTMAESIAMHLKDNPDRKVLHLDGNFHSASHLGTVERLKLRMPELKIAVINPIGAEDNSAPALTEEELATGDYILLVQQLPEDFLCKARELDYQMKVIKKRMGNKCVYSEETAQHEEKS